MVPTIPWMRQNFNIYNQKYFGGKLPIPQFSLDAPDGMWGCYDVDANFDTRTRKITRVGNTGTLSLTNKYSRPEQSVISTMLHEMVHEYLYLVLKIYPKDKHGKEFMSVAQPINADGWKIESETFETDDDTAVDDAPQTSVICVIRRQNSPDINWWVCKADISQIDAMKRAARTINGVTAVAFYECNTSCLEHLRSNPAELSGWGGKTYKEAITAMAKYCGVSPSVFSGANLRPLKK